MACQAGSASDRLRASRCGTLGTVQLRSLTLYSRDGEGRVVEFRPGELNIVTGEPRTGKSALLTIVEYCLGRDSMLVPVGPIADTVSWYAATWELGGGGQAFVARPAPQTGRASTQRAMLEFGSDLEQVPFDRLEVNADSDALRQQLGRRIGIEENQQLPPAGSLRQPLEAHLGHAALLCLQTQSEIANQIHLFHRQGERGIDDALRDTIPFFLGAVPRDQALKRARLRDAQRVLQRTEAALRIAEAAAATIDVELASLVEEARAVGLTDVEQIATRAEMISVLTAARQAPAPDMPPPLDPADQDRRRALEQQRDEAMSSLRQLTADRDLLLEQSASEAGYVDAIELQAGRLASLGLLEPPGGTDDDDSGHTDAMTCPACGQQFDQSDTTAAQLSDHLDRLRRQLVDITNARPAKRIALERLEHTAAEVRERLQIAENALSALRGAENVATPSGGNRDFVRGRIDAVLSRAASTDEIEVLRLRQTRETAAATVAALEGELDDNSEREQLTSRLLSVGRDMTDYAERLQLEHRGPNVRLDLARLTVVTDTDTGPAPLFRIGSAENWIGYHLVTHLALHRYFVRHNRPVPRLLMLDQPTQAYYPSEVAKQTGVADSDTDRAAVRRLFELIRDVVAELAPEMQIIVCDHANLPEQWFQDAVIHNWREGRKLIPASWLT
jgi:hypothetical protein